MQNNNLQGQQQQPITNPVPSHRITRIARLKKSQEEQFEKIRRLYDTNFASRQSKSKSSSIKKTLISHSFSSTPNALPELCPIPPTSSTSRPILNQDLFAVADNKYQKQEEKTRYLLPSTREHQKRITYNQDPYFHQAHRYGMTFRDKAKSLQSKNTPFKLVCSFVFESNQDRVRRFLIQKQWKSTKSKNATSFVLKWVDLANSLDFVFLRDNQYINQIRYLGDSLSVSHLNNKLRDSENWPRTYNLQRDKQQFLDEYERCGVLNFLKKHFQYFRNNPFCQKLLSTTFKTEVTLSQILKMEKYYQERNPLLLVNVPLLIQACLYFQQLTCELLNKKSQLSSIRLDPKTIHNISNFSKFDPPYEQLQETMRSTLESPPRDKSNIDKSLVFSKDYTKYKTTGPSFNALDTPSIQLIRLVCSYQSILQQKLSYYAADGTSNQWRTIDERSHSRPFNIRAYLANQQSCSLTPLSVHKVVETYPQASGPTRITSLVLVIAVENGVKIYRLRKCQVDLEQQNKQCQLQEYFGNHPQLQMTVVEFQQKLQKLLVASINPKQFECRKRCFQLLEYVITLDAAAKLWLQEVRHSQLASFTDDCFLASRNQQSIIQEMFSLIMPQHFQINKSEYWAPVQNLVAIKKQNETAVRWALHNKIKGPLYRIKAENELRSLVVKYQILWKQSLQRAMRELRNYKETKRKDLMVNLKIGVTLLMRLHRRRVKGAFHQVENCTQQIMQQD